MYKNKYIDKDKKLFVMPKDYYLTKKKSDENNITEWDNYDYILIPSDSDRNEEEWKKNKKGELEILRGDGGCPFTCHTSKQNCPSGDGYCGYSAKHGRCTCHSHAPPAPPPPLNESCSHVKTPCILDMNCGYCPKGSKCGSIYNPDDYESCDKVEPPCIIGHNCGYCNTGNFCYN